MKSFLLHFSLLLAMLAGGCLQSWADGSVAFTVSPSDGSATYEYYVRSARKWTRHSVSPTYYALKELNNTQVKFANSGDAMRVKLTANGSEENAYYIIPTNVSVSGVIGYYSLSEAQTLSVASSATSGITTKWYVKNRDFSFFEEDSGNNTDEATIENIYTIACTSGDNNSTLGWNTYGGTTGTVIKLYRITDPGSSWYFEPANAAAYIAALGETYTEAKKYVSECANTVGYPTSTSTAYTELKAAVEAVDNTTDDYATAKSNLESKLSAYKQATSDINLPEDGKVYKIFAVFHDNAEYALYWNSAASYNGGTGRMAGDTEENLSSNASRYFFCHKVGDKFMFVNKDGKYLTWLDPYSSDTKFRTGATDDYDATKDLWTISRADLTKSGGKIYPSLTVADLVGLVQMNAVGNTSGTTFYLNPRKETNNDNGGIMDFVSGRTNEKYYDENGNRTFAFRFEEVTDYIPMVFKTGGWNSDDNFYYATYSTPFPVTMPENVKAYTAAEYVNGSRDLVLTEVTGETIPENVGLLVKYSGELENGVKNIIPVPSIESATSTNNGLTPTNGDRVATFTGTPYVMANKSEGLGFYPLNSGQGVPAFRAYLNLSAQSEEEAVKLTFNNSSVSGISNAASVDSNDNAPVYDLSGRIVSKPLKGIYIKNGKKFVVK